MTYREGVRHATKEARWTVWHVFVAILSLSVVIGVIGWMLNIMSQPAKIVEKTLDADNVIYNYEWFKLQHDDIRASQVQIDNAETAISEFEDGLGPRSEWDIFDKKEHGRLGSVVLGLRNHRADMIAEYNAKSRMANRSIFKTEGPDQLPLTMEDDNQ